MEVLPEPGAPFAPFFDTMVVVFLTAPVAPVFLVEVDICPELDTEMNLRIPRSYPLFPFYFLTVVEVEVPKPFDSCARERV